MTKHRFGMQRKATIWLGVGVVLSGLAIAALRMSPLAFAPPAPAAQWIPVHPAPLTVRVGLVGRLEAESTLTVTAPFDGTIQDKLVSEGQRVLQGQQLFSLNTTQLDIQMRQALAELLKAKRAVQDLETWADSQDVGRTRRTQATARMSLADTERKLTETRQLLDRGIVPRMEVDALEQQARQQRLDLTAADADLKATLARGQGESRQIADMELANATARYDDLVAARERRNITAPFAGIAVSLQGAGGGPPVVPIYAGARVAPGQPLIGLASVERIKAVAKVDEGDINQLHEGLSVEISGDGFEGIVLQGRIESVGMQSTSADTQGAGAAYQIVVGIPPLSTQQQASIRLGMSARLSIIVYRNEHAVVIPAAAVTRRGEKFVVTHRGSPEQPARQVEVTTGRAAPSGIEIFGLPAGYVEVSEIGE